MILFIKKFYVLVKDCTYHIMIACKEISTKPKTKKKAATYCLYNKNYAYKCIKREMREPKLSLMKFVSDMPCNYSASVTYTLSRKQEVWNNFCNSLNKHLATIKRSIYFCVRPKSFTFFYKLFFKKSFNINVVKK